ncbi:O-antigen ligase family protein [Schlesneria paludicola]|uniref:O-antigen ligase family protein n=1 Tax=Schlesneria paludicola TaxID=360056 RepID=UPI000299F99A|nr:O-antigen ligase family protein [Schlesneria paludicola]
MRDKSIANLCYFLFTLTTATLFLRPAELFIWLADWPIYESLILSTLFLSLQSIQGHFSWFYLQRQPITLCVTAVLPAIIVSHLQHVYIGGAIEGATLFVKTLIYYGLLVTVVNSPSRLRGFMLVVAMCATTMVMLCVIDFFEIVDFEFIQHLDDNDSVTDEGEVVTVLRMRGTGIFQDPNDLAAAVMLAGTLCAYFLTDKSFGSLRFGWLIPLSILFTGLICTKSRGGLLACGVAGLMYIICRYGGKVATVAAVAGACALPFVASRQTEVDLEEGTGQERIQLWRDGFDALKSPDILFGIGQGGYPDVAGLVAHNSFIHAYVELGIVGGTFFFGGFFFAAMQLYRMVRIPEEIENPELLRMRPFIVALLAGWATALCSLSRCYVVPTYLVLGTCASYLNLVWIYTDAGEPLVIWNRGHLFRLVVASGCMFTGLYVFTAILAR